MTQPELVITVAKSKEGIKELVEMIRTEQDEQVIDDLLEVLIDLLKECDKHPIEEVLMRRKIRAKYQREISNRKSEHIKEELSEQFCKSKRTIERILKGE